MASEKRQGLPEFWTSHLAKILSGDQPCELATWAPAHFKLPKRPRSDEGALAEWRARHTELLRTTDEVYRQQGWKTDKERYFKVVGTHAVLVGKVDLIAQKTDCRPVIIDTKGGKERSSDVTQVLIEMIGIPMAWNAPTMRFDGKVVYSESNVVQISAWDADKLKPKLVTLLKRLGMMQKPPEPSPSESACKYCEVPDDLCSQRVSGGPQEAVTDLF